jgi:energy-coupling factor transporter ATP-binding protein EcfA2
VETLSLSDFLMRNGFYLDETVATLIELVIQSQAPTKFLLSGPPGSGKTHLTSLVAKLMIIRTWKQWLPYCGSGKQIYLITIESAGSENTDGFAIKEVDG